ncbi:hypothetical protein BGZ46_000113 [Entomortierella lignicola]|nr:hypothetical protein BGZ46_000113 [Entomortierella lignicola]
MLNIFETKLNYHAPARFCHIYFHNNGHLNWRFDAFHVAVVSNPKDPAITDEETVYQWNTNIQLIVQSPFVPETVINAISKLLIGDQSTSNITGMAIRAKLYRNMAEAGLAHKEVAIAATVAVDEWLEKPSVPKKRKRQLDWSAMVKDPSNSIPYVNTLSLRDAKKLPREAKDVLVNFKLRDRNTGDMVWAINLFRQATNWKTMKVLEHEFHAQMEIWDLYDQKQEDRFYLREMYIKAANLWQRDVLGKGSLNNEGWLLWNLHGPLMDVFKAIRHVKLRATDLKGRNNSHGDKHDMLVTHGVFPLDVVIMEAKRHKQKSPRTIDVEKVARTMAGNLARALQLIPENLHGEYIKIMRSFGMVNSALNITLLEARFIDGVPVVYEIRRFDVPEGPLICSKFVEGLSYMIAYKDRVRGFLDTLAEVISNISPASSQHADSDVESEDGGSREGSKDDEEEDE